MKLGFVVPAGDKMTTMFPNHSLAEGRADVTNKRTEGQLYASALGLKEASDGFQVKMRETETE